MSAAELHRSWLTLVDTEGPFLAVPPLKRVWPQGMPALAVEAKAALASAHRTFVAGWESYDRDPSTEHALANYRDARDAWVQVVLRDVAGWAESMSWDEIPGLVASSPGREVTVTAQAAIRDGDGWGCLVHFVDPIDSLRQAPGDRWAASPVDRLEALLRAGGPEVGLVTDGRWWGLVCAREGAMVASGVVDALDWVAEPRVRDAFFSLVSRRHLIGGDPAERLPVLFKDSVAEAEEITEALGAQVRQAVELLIQSFAESAAESQRHGLPDPLPRRAHDTYEGAVTVLMRIVFLLFAEERGLLPTGELFEQGYGISGELARLVKREAAETEEALDSTSLTWHRLLATSRALYTGASFENLRMPPYGGSLFDPSRFPFLTGTTDQETLALTVPDRVMLHVLRSVQLPRLKSGEARQISFRELDVEQIGYIYEGLLGYTAERVDEPHLGLIGKAGSEPEIPMAVLEDLAAEHAEPRKLAEAIRQWLKDDQPAAVPASATAIAKGIGAEADSGAVSALRQAVGDDTALHDRVLPWLGLARLDLRKQPFVVLDGGLLVKETPSRRNAGAHYTPKSLATEVVKHALEPLCFNPGPHQTADESQWKPKTSEQILALKVADIACGSGAFLVAAARYLSERVVEAWVRQNPDHEARTDLEGRAIREVVASCLYGADINEMAVEMCKLSLWLVSLDRHQPFSFVDDKIFLGNSLLGLTDVQQLRTLHIDPSRAKKLETYGVDDVEVKEVVRRASELRTQLATEIDDRDPARDGAAKRRQLADLRRLTADLRRLADGVIAAGLPWGGKPGGKLDDAYENLRIAARAAAPRNGEPGNPAMLDTLIDKGLTPTVATDYRRWQPLHWVLEAPDVMVDHGGFDAIVGNPPFLGGKKVTGAVGSDVRDWMVFQLAGGVRGNADLVAYFFLRARNLLANTGKLGLIATNTIAQGDTREVGLDQAVASGFAISRAVRSRRWPATGVNLEYAAIWGSLTPLLSEAALNLDGVSVPSISTYLEPAGRSFGYPVRLAENRNAAFIGVYPLGMGFVVSPEEAENWLSASPKNSDVLLPFLNGDDLYSRPDVSASRWIVDFNDWSKERAQEYELPFGRIEERVRPERQRQDAHGQFVLRAPLPTRWWQFADKRPALRKAILQLGQVLAVTIVSKSLMPVRISARQILSNSLCVFPTDSYAQQAILSSSVHQAWVIKYGSGMRTDPRYTPSDVFETFPRAGDTLGLATAGHNLEEVRREIMLRRQLGLTALYNLVNDPAIADAVEPDVARMRDIHMRLDRAVMGAYGWGDVPLDHGFHTYRQMTRWTVSPAARVEILDRLLEENHRRAAAEQAAGVTGKGSKPRIPSEEQESLFP
ncbi:MULTISPECIES: DNA methyltransferase [unclassified Modestobacter]|uniref:DNA methyltransferase n=1 Tax=unclassified Modestobacter TaxID=2643866 RepID=UPI0022AAD06A|nr:MULTISPECIES: DNA methyltransferase [unclassified Modestobacter]MCZ2826682.1 N-6 DNA methylase [Modestobacter sp. VKM Ac-2981]MCZ2855062.1 N-6 DNA methylase [Modestobacter sp. VKM Ac-2982]